MRPLRLLLLVLLLVPQMAFAAFTVPLNATTTSGTIIAYPTPVNGTYPILMSPFYLATSTTASFFPYASTTGISASGSSYSNGIYNFGIPIASTTRTVCLQGAPYCQYTDPADAVADACAASPSAPGIVHIKTGTYTGLKALSVPSGCSHLVIEGEGEGTVLRWSRFTFPTYFFAVGSAETNGIIMRDLEISQSNSAGTSVCMDVGQMSNSYFYNLQLRNCATMLLASTTHTFEDTFQNIDIHTTSDASSGVAIYGGANNNTFINIAVANAWNSVKGFYCDAHSEKVMGLDVESYASYGLYLGPNCNELDATGVYTELNQTNIFASAGLYGVNISGTTESASTTAQNFVNYSTTGVRFDGGNAFAASNFFFGNYGFGTSTPGSAALAIQGNIFLAGNITSTSTLASIFPYASTTATSAQFFCLTGDSCISAWPTGSGGTGAATTSFAATSPVTINTTASAITYGWTAPATSALSIPYASSTVTSATQELGVSSGGMLNLEGGASEGSWALCRDCVTSVRSILASNSLYALAGSSAGQGFNISNASNKTSIAEFSSNDFRTFFRGIMGIATTTSKVAGMPQLQVATSSAPQLGLYSGSNSFGYIFRNQADGSLTISTSTLSGSTSTVPDLTINSNSIVGVEALTIADLTNGNCLQAGSNGRITSTGSACGTGGGSGAATTSFATAGAPITLTTSASAITYGFTGLTTTTQPTAGQLLESNGSNGVFGASTSTLSASSPLTGSFTQVGSGGSLGIQAASASQDGYESSADYQLAHAATTTFSSPLVYTLSTNAVTCPTCTVGGLTSYDAFSHLNDFATTTSATNTSIWTQGVFFSSSTVAASQFPYASSTALTAGNLFATNATFTNALPIASGGTNASSFTTSGNALYYNGTSLLTAPTNSAITIPYASSTGLSVTSELGVSSGGDINFEAGASEGIWGIGRQFGTLTKLMLTGNTLNFLARVSSSGDTQGFAFVGLSGATAGELSATGNLYLKNSLRVGTTSATGGAAIQGNVFLAGNITSTSSLASIFPYASTTAITATTASSTNLIVSSAGGTAGCATFADDGTISNTHSACGGSAGANPFTWGTSNFGTSTAATTSSIWTQGVFFSSSTVATSTFAGGLKLGNNTTPFVYNWSTGAVGVGTDASGGLDNYTSDPVALEVYRGGQNSVVTVNTDSTSRDARIDFGDDPFNQSIEGSVGYRNSTLQLMATNAHNRDLVLGTNGIDTLHIVGGSNNPNSGNIGVGTTSAMARLTIAANPYDQSIANVLFQISSSTSNSTTTLFSISNTGSTTISNGLNITNGCFAQNGTCLSLTDTIGNWFTTGNVFGTTSAATTTSIWTQGVFFSSSTIATSTFAGDVFIGSNNVQPGPYLLIATSSVNPNYGRLQGDGIVLALNYNGNAAINASNGSTGSCASSEFIANGNNPTLTGFFGAFMFLNDGWTGAGCALGELRGPKPEAEVLWNPTGEIDNVVSSTTVGVNWFGGGTNAGNIVMALTGTSTGSKLGLSTSTPWGLLSLAPSTWASTTPQFVSWVQGSTSPSFEIGGANANGYITIGTTTPKGRVTIDTVAGDIGGLIINTWSNITNAFSIKNAAGTTVFNVDTTAANPFFGVGSSTPWGTLTSVGDGTDPVLAVATSTTGLPNFEIDTKGHIITSGPKPTASNCGTSPSVTGNDEAGNITTGTASPKSCTLTFANTYGTAPSCVVGGGPPSGGGLGAGTLISSTTATTLSFMSVASSTAIYAGMTSFVISYRCFGLQ